MKKTYEVLRLVATALSVVASIFALYKVLPVQGQQEALAKVVSDVVEGTRGPVADTGIALEPPDATGNARVMVRGLPGDSVAFTVSRVPPDTRPGSVVGIDYVRPGVKVDPEAWRQVLDLAKKPRPKLR